MGQKYGYRKGLLLLILVSLVCLFSQLTAADSSAASQCAASEEYLSELKRYGSSLTVDKDFSCLTDLPSLGKKLSSLQLIDTRLHASSTEKLSKDVWLMPVSELKNKSFLLNKPLLLVGDGFSRANAANDCAILKKAGFTAVKILVGGIDLWASVQKNTSSRNDTIPSVSAQQLIFEYFNHRVSIISTSNEVSAKLAEMGVTKFYPLENNNQTLSDIVLTKSSNGYDPVVIVSESGNYQPKVPTKFHNLYQLGGGIAALRQQLEGNIWINRNRADAPRSYFCGRR